MKDLLRWGGVALGLTILLAGCGDSGIGGAKVSGKVTVAGQPVKDVIVTFAPETGGRPATGVTDASGYYSLATLAKGDGALPGKYKVVFSMVQSDPGSSTAPTAPPPPPFNAKYLTGETSGFSKEVKAGSNTIDFDLEK